MKLETHEELALQCLGYKVGHSSRGVLHLEHTPAPPSTTSTQLRALARTFDSIADKLDIEAREEKEALQKRVDAYGDLNASK